MITSSTPVLTLSKAQVIKYSILIAVAFIALLFLFRSCGNSMPDHKYDKAYVDSLQKDGQKLLAIYVEQSAYKDAVIEQLVHERDSIKGELQVRNKALLSTQSSLKTAIAKAKDSKVPADTSAYARNCDTVIAHADTLSRQVDSARNQVVLLEKKNDSLQLLSDERIDNATSIIGVMQSNNDKITGKYNVLFKDYSKLQRKNNGNKFATRWLAGGVIAALIYGILK